MQYWSCGLAEGGVFLPCWPHNKMKALEKDRQWCLRRGDMPSKRLEALDKSVQD